jgi:hypothetical protein
MRKSLGEMAQYLCRRTHFYGNRMRLVGAVDLSSCTGAGKLVRDIKATRKTPSFFPE